MHFLSNKTLNQTFTVNKKIRDKEKRKIAKLEKKKQQQQQPNKQEANRKKIDKSEMCF